LHYHGRITEFFIEGSRMRTSPLRTAVFTAALVVLVVGRGSSVSAQYFGQNKVQYKNLDFKILKTEHFDIYFYPSEREGIDIAARLSERWLARLERVFEHQLRGRQPLVLYASHTDFEQNNIIPGEMGEGTGGVTEPVRRRIVLPFGGPLSDTDHVIGHELVHAFQFDITTRPNMAPGENGAERLPLWFIEGMAEYLSLGPVDPNTAMWLRDAARQEKLPSIDDLDNPKYFPYRWGQAFWAYVGGRFGDDVIRQMLSLAASAGDVNLAIKRITGLTTKELSNDWHEAIRRAYEPVLASTTTPGEAGRMVIRATDLTDLNVGPSISPDGRWLAFLSSRGFFSIDLYVADAATGKIVRKLTSTATDPHFSSIQFIYSAGAWDNSSRRLAIATVTAGQAALAIFDAQSGNKEREVKVGGVDEILNPTWAPDGHAVCFTGMSAGLTDLYIYDLNASHLRRLTNDAFADLQPAWSPDGKRIAFSTDRFSSNLNTLSIGQYRLAMIDPETGHIDQVRAFTGGKNINPQWAPDGSALYFIADRDGIPNLYRVMLGTGDVSQLTTVGTGLSGITNTSPALSVASSAGVAAFSVYEGGKYDIFTLDVAQRGRPPSDADMRAATLPPIDRKPSQVAALLDDATFGLPPTPQPVEVTDYKAKLQLEGMGQPAVAVGASRYGAAFGGGISFMFGDMLGNHNLFTAVQANTGLTGAFDAKDIAAEAGYFNQAHRWNWGIIGGQVPYLSAGFASDLGVVGNEPVEVDQTIVFRQTERSATGIVAYPFNRAERVEFQAAATQISFDEVVRSQVYSLNTGQLLSDDTNTTPLARSLNLATTSAAFVHDTSSFGATSPVQGTRYRVEADPTFGSINYTGLLADYRRYFMPFPFYTLAGRVMHYGRYGSGAEDQRLFPLYLGYPTLVRGYDVNTFDNSDCVANAVSPCPLFDRLLGSRMLVANVEFRFPLLRPFGVSQRMYGPVPVEVALFADGGVAWNSLSQATAIGVTGSVTQPQAFKLSNGVSSAGVALRVNLFGFAVGEFDFARPFQRPGQGWVFQFNLAPGF
jgi:Tol biopolymer transport system component